MHSSIFYSCLCLITIQTSAKVIPNTDQIRNYLIIRNNIINYEQIKTIQNGGVSSDLNEEENIANNILMNFKAKEIEEYFTNAKKFNFTNHYFSYKNQINNSNVYQIIRAMPKGGALHIHSTFMLNADELLRLTYEDHLYVCYTDHDLKLLFSDGIPERPCPVEWALLSELRAASGDDVETLNNNLKKFFTLYTEDERDMQLDINKAWERFDKVYATIKSLIVYRPVREKYFYMALKKFYDDNVMYIELRGGIQTLYELDGTILERTTQIKLYQNITEQFIKEHPDFIGIKMIITRHRKGSIDDIRKSLDFVRKAKKEMPEMIAGFDLVGQEDKGHPLIHFVPALLEARDEIDFYFHGGETNWSGTSSDENLIDAILLRSKRIGHAYALPKHPSLMETVLQLDIALEINVVSNLVLSHVRDVRNHPLATLLANGLPIVLSSDDPGVWGADPLSHDFYIAFVAIASKRADLRLLKKFALNSIKYSALNDSGKSRFLAVFNDRWNTFIKTVIETYT